MGCENMTGYLSNTPGRSNSFADIISSALGIRQKTRRQKNAADLSSYGGKFTLYGGNFFFPICFNAVNKTKPSQQNKETN